MPEYKLDVSLLPLKVDDFPVRVVFVSLVLLISAVLVPSARAASGQYISNNTPAYVSSATNLGAANPSDTINVTLWLKPHNQAGLDAVAQALYNPSSGEYRHWLKNSEIAAQFGPSAAETKTVEEFLTSNSLKIAAVGPDNFYVRASGTVAQIQTAFHVQLDDYKVGEQTIRANAGDPYIDGPAAALVQVVSGLDSGAFQHPLDLRPASLSSSSTLSPHGSLQNAASSSDSGFFQTVCFPGPETEKFATLGTYPKATYSGNAYVSGPFGCGYSPSNLYAAYDLNELYAEGFDGTGQTVLILDWCGSPTILGDANVFSERFNLPPLTSANFKIINYPTVSACAGVDLEINLDVEWTHAIAPGANIDLIVPPSADFDDVDEAMFFAATSGLGNVISGSFATPEFFVSHAELTKENLIAEIAEVAGVGANFASGDSGNYTTDFMPPNVSVPADLPHATGVGGVSVALNADNTIAFQTGWETHESILMQGGAIYDPLHTYNFYGFGGGSGGGPSAFFSKPSFQEKIAGAYRQVPDISWLADPFTGAAVLITNPSQVPAQLWYSVGGTSLSTPMFSALWAIANQEAGTPLGQAAPYLYSMPASTITDILPRTSVHNATAVIEESASVTNSFNPSNTLLVDQPLFGTFYSTLWNDPAEEDTLLTVSFGGDYYLKVTPGWDDVTGLGTPSAKAFADWFAPRSGK